MTGISGDSLQPDLTSRLQDLLLLMGENDEEGRPIDRRGVGFTEGSKEEDQRQLVEDLLYLLAGGEGQSLGEEKGEEEEEEEEEAPLQRASNVAEKETLLPTGICVKAQGVGGWYPRTGTFNGAAMFSRELEGETKLNLVRYSHKNNKDYWYLSDIRNRSEPGDDVDYWRTAAACDGCRLPPMASSAWTPLALDRGLFQQPALQLTVGQGESSCHHAGGAAEEVEAGDGIILLVIEILAENDVLLLLVTASAIMLITKILRAVRLSQALSYLATCAARTGLTGVAATCAALLMLLLFEHVHRLDWATNVDIALNALVSPLALPVWANLVRLAVHRSFCALRWLALGPLRPEEEGAQLNLFYQECSTLVALVGAMFWAGADDLIFASLVVATTGLSALALLSGLALKRLQWMLAHHSTTSATPAGQEMFRGVAHARLFACFTLVAVAVTCIGLWSIPSGVNRPVDLLKCPLLFARAAKSAVIGILY